MAVERRPATEEEARTLASPLRLRILRLCLDVSLTNKEIAERLGTATGTIKIHVQNILEKLSASDRTQAVTIAIQRGILHLS